MKKQVIISVLGGIEDMFDTYMNSVLPSPVIQIMRKILVSGYGAWLVGGAVRDILQKKIPTDWDIAVGTDMDAISSLFPGALCLGRGRRASCSMNLSGWNIQISPLKGRTIDEDLGRRDFTVNSMALDISGRLLDPFGGADDIASSILRFTGSPENRIVEDPLRLLRMCRIAACLEMEVPASDMSVARRYRYRISSVSPQRSGDEILKGFRGRCGPFWTLMEKAGFLGILFPFIFHHIHMPFPFENYPFPDLVKKMMAVIDGSDLPDEHSVSLLYMPQLFRKEEPALGCTLKEDPLKQWGWPVSLRYRSRWRAQITPLLLVPLEGQDIYRIHLSGERCGKLDDLFFFAELLAGALPVSKEKDCLSILEANREKLKRILPILKNREVFPGGGDIIELLHIPPGPSIGRVRKALGIEIANGNISSREETVKYLRHIL